MKKRACDANELRWAALCIGAVHFLKVMTDDEEGGGENADALARRIVEKVCERFRGIKFRGADACDLVGECAEWLGIEAWNRGREDEG